MGLLFPLASASFTKGNASQNLKTTYGAGEKLEGWINISLSNQASESIFSASENFNGSISLENLLTENDIDCSSSDECSCIPDNCEDSYKEAGGAAIKSISLDYGEDEVLAFILNGKNIEVTSLSFDFTVINSPSCNNPLEMDLLNDDVIDWIAGKMSSVYDCGSAGEGEIGKGCFEDSGTEETRIGSNTYCEKIELNGKKFKVGAWVRGNDSTAWTNGTLIMDVYDEDSNKLKSCNLPQPSTSAGEISCTMQFSEELEGDYYVCLNATKETYYRTKRESNEPCGFYGNPGNYPDYSYDYYVFAKTPKFDSIGKVNYTQQEFAANGGENLVEYINDYIVNTYNKNCTSGCLIPVKFTAGTGLTIEVSNIRLGYRKEGAPQDPENKIYETTLESAKVSSKFLQLQLENSGIFVPKTIGNHTLKIYLDEAEIISQKINVANVPIIKTVSPTIISAAVPVKFTANVSVPSGRSIVKYEWDFGDENTENTTTNYVTHIYSEVGDYELKLDVTDNLNFKASKTFSIEAGSPREVVNFTLVKYKARINNLTYQLSALPAWYKDVVKSSIGFDDLNTELTGLEQDYNTASIDDEYIDIATQLLAMDVPYLVKEGGTGNLPFFANPDDISPEALSGLGAGNYETENEEGYKNAVAAWSQNNFDAVLDAKYIRKYTDSGSENILSVFDLKITKKTDVEGNFYIVIENPDVIFSLAENKKDVENGVGISFADSESKNIEFAIPMDIPISELVAYFSPDFNKLEIAEEFAPCDYDGICEKDNDESSKNCRSDCKPWGTAAILIIIVVVFGVVAYILLQWWYKVRYETFLFKNRNDVYNLVNFMNNARTQGLSDNEISNRLKKAGWKGEQINYVFKKIAGKAIMPFDFLKLFKKFKK